MLSPISFQGTFRAYITGTNPKRRAYAHPQLEKFCAAKEITFDETFLDGKQPLPKQNIKIIEKDKNPSDRFFAYYTIFTPDEHDTDLKAFMRANGIKYEQLSPEMVTQEGIKKRLKPAGAGYSLVYVNSEKIEELLKTQRDSNFQQAKKDYDKFYKGKSQLILRSSEEIEPPVLYVNCNAYDGDPNDLKNYINDYGMESLGPNMVGVWQIQQGKDRDINMYYAMQDVGMKDIPVYLDRLSIENAQILGLLSDTEQEA